MKRTSARKTTAVMAVAIAATLSGCGSDKNAAAPKDPPVEDRPPTVPARIP